MVKDTSKIGTSTRPTVSFPTSEQFAEIKYINAECGWLRILTHVQEAHLSKTSTEANGERYAESHCSKYRATRVDGKCN